MNKPRIQSNIIHRDRNGKEIVDGATVLHKKNLYRIEQIGTVLYGEALQNMRGKPKRRMFFSYEIEVV